MIINVSLLIKVTFSALMQMLTGGSQKWDLNRFVQIHPLITHCLVQMLRGVPLNQKQLVRFTLLAMNLSGLCSAVQPFDPLMICVRPLFLCFVFRR